MYVNNLKSLIGMGTIVNVIAFQTHDQICRTRYITGSASSGPNVAEPLDLITAAIVDRTRASLVSGGVMTMTHSPETSGAINS